VQSIRKKNYSKVKRKHCQYEMNVQNFVATLRHKTKTVQEEYIYQSKKKMYQCMKRYIPAQQDNNVTVEQDKLYQYREGNVHVQRGECTCKEREMYQCREGNVPVQRGEYISTERGMYQYKEGNVLVQRGECTCTERGMYQCPKTTTEQKRILGRGFGQTHNTDRRNHNHLLKNKLSSRQVNKQFYWCTDSHHCKINK
jgi:hypothetical protein